MGLISSMMFTTMSSLSALHQHMLINRDDPLFRTAICISEVIHTGLCSFWRMIAPEWSLRDTATRVVLSFLPWFFYNPFPTISLREWNIDCYKDKIDCCFSQYLRVRKKISQIGFFYDLTSVSFLPHFIESNILGKSRKESFFKTFNLCLLQCYSVSKSIGMYSYAEITWWPLYHNLAHFFPCLSKVFREVLKMYHNEESRSVMRFGPGQHVGAPCLPTYPMGLHID